MLPSFHAAPESASRAVHQLALLPRGVGKVVNGAPRREMFVPCRKRTGDPSCDITFQSIAKLKGMFAQFLVDLSLARLDIRAAGV